MTISGYSNAIVDVMLGWLKGLANWVLRLFNLAGSVTTSPLLWLSQNWLKLLIFFLALGLIVDGLVWLIRWRPYWVWFRKERVIVNDEKFFASADMDKAPDWERNLSGNWDEHDYVVASTVVRRKSGERARGAVVKDGRRSSKADQSRARRRSAKVERHVPSSDKAASGKRRSAVSDTGAARRARTSDVRTPDSIFAGKLTKPEVSDLYEDEVFNVSNLPVADEFSDRREPRRRDETGERREYRKRDATGERRESRRRK